jgi:mannosyltransferase
MDASFQHAVSSTDLFAALPQAIRSSSVGRHRAVALLLIFAVAVGSLLRFSNIGSREMSADEGASWAAANASTISEVLQLQPRLNPGKFALHEVLLHGWIRLFGDGLVAMRALSGVAGVIGIVAVFFVTRELVRVQDVFQRAAKPAQEGPETPSDMLAAAVGAVLFAINLIFIKYAQEARMYSVALLCALMQVGSFLRYLYRPTLVMFFLIALFTALAIAATFTMSLVLAPEFLWLVYVGRLRHRAIWPREVFAGLALLGSLPLLFGPAIIYLHERAHAPALLAYAWASSPPFWAPLSMFNKATGSVAFPVTLALALWGAARSWRHQREMLMFLLLWMLVPPLLILTASYLIRPAFVERYLLASFVPFFLLIAFAIKNLDSVPAQTAVLGLVAFLAIGHEYSYWRHPHDVQWREAVQAAVTTTGRTITVAPPYASDVVRYYLQNFSNHLSVEAGDTKSATVAIVADSGVSKSEDAHLATVFPRLLMRLRGVIVRGH